MTYEQFTTLNRGDTITLAEFHELYEGNTATIKDNSVRGAKTVSVKEVKIGDMVNNGTRFIEVV